MNEYISKLETDEFGNERIVPHYDYLDFTKLSNDGVDLFKASKNGDKGTIDKLIRAGVDCDCHNDAGTTALMIAVDYQYYGIAETLLKNGTDVNSIEIVDTGIGDGFGASAMNLATRNKDRRMIELLLDYGADINERSGIYGESPLLIALWLKDYDYMDFLFQKGADPNIELNNGETGLINAVKLRDKKLAKYLIENGANVNHKNITGLSALDVANSFDFEDVQSFLIDLGTTGENRMFENLSLHRHDGYYVENDMAYAYYYWNTDDGFLHILIYGVGYMNIWFAMSEIRKFYIRTNSDVTETFAGNENVWLHYIRTENGEKVAEYFNTYGKNINKWASIMCDKDGAFFPPKVLKRFSPSQSKMFDFDGKFQKLSSHLKQFVEIDEKEIEADYPSIKESFEIFRFTIKGWNFLGQYLMSRSVIERKEIEIKVMDLLIDYFTY